MPEPVTLASLSNGAALERFDDELAKVFENILDPNTKAEALRSVTLTVKIKPSENRDIGATEFVVTAKIAAPKPIATVLFIGRKNGKIVAEERDSNQMEMEELNPKITKLNGHK